MIRSPYYEAIRKQQKRNHPSTLSPEELAKLKLSPQSLGLPLYQNFTQTPKVEVNFLPPLNQILNIIEARIRFYHTILNFIRSGVSDEESMAYFYDLYGKGVIEKAYKRTQVTREKFREALIFLLTSNVINFYVHAKDAIQISGPQSKACFDHIYLIFYFEHMTLKKFNKKNKKFGLASIDHPELIHFQEIMDLLEPHVTPVSNIIKQYVQFDFAKDKFDYEKLFKSFEQGCKSIQEIMGKIDGILRELAERGIRVPEQISSNIILLYLLEERRELQFYKDKEILLNYNNSQDFLDKTGFNIKIVMLISLGNYVIEQNKAKIHLKEVLENLTRLRTANDFEKSELEQELEQELELASNEKKEGKQEQEEQEEEQQEQATLGNQFNKLTLSNPASAPGTKKKEAKENKCESIDYLHYERNPETYLQRVTRKLSHVEETFTLIFQKPHRKLTYGEIFHCVKILEGEVNSKGKTAGCRREVSVPCLDNSHASFVEPPLEKSVTIHEPHDKDDDLAPSYFVAVIADLFTDAGSVPERLLKAKSKMKP